MDIDNFLEKDYELKINYLNAHFSHMWTRFNFFLTIHSALLGLSFHHDYKDSVIWISLIGLALSFLWFIFAATDNYLVEVYRRQVAHVFHLLKPSLRNMFNGIGLKDIPYGYSYVGSLHPNKNPIAFDSESKVVKKVDSKWCKLQFRIPNFSVTELGVTFAIVFIVIWVIQCYTNWPLSWTKLALFNNT